MVLHIWCTHCTSEGIECRLGITAFKLTSFCTFTYRIGQTKNVFVHRLITQNTFEERIDEMLKQKQSLSDMSISVKESWITELSNDELRKLFTRTP